MDKRSSNTAQQMTRLRKILSRNWDIFRLRSNKQGLTSAMCKFHSASTRHCTRNTDECGEPKIAAEILDSVLTSQHPSISSEVPDRIRASLALAQSFVQMGELDSADEALRSIEEDAPRFFTSDHPFKLKPETTKALILHLRGGPGDAVVTGLRDTITRLKRVLGYLHVDTLYSQILLGRILYEQGATQQGLELIEASLKALRGYLGASHPKLNALARLQSSPLAKFWQVMEKGIEHSR